MKYFNFFLLSHKLINIITLILFICGRWSDGTAANYLKWNANEPNDAWHGERCVSTYLSGKILYGSNNSSTQIDSE